MSDQQFESIKIINSSKNDISVKSKDNTEVNNISNHKKKAKKSLNKIK